MTNQISFMSANYVARQLGYHMTEGWGQGDRAAQEHFRPLETFPERFEEILRDVRGMGFEAMDLWTAQLYPVWATDEHVAAARDLHHRYKLPVPSLAGWFGATPQEFEASCRLAVALDCPLLAGSTSMLEKDRAFVIRTLKTYGLKLGIENHPEKNAKELLARIGDGGDGTIGAAIDTGWYGTQGYDAIGAIKELREYLFYVHLKDVLAPGRHDTCRYGRGVVPIQACVQALRRVGYERGISVEHEPEEYDPTEDCIANLAMLRQWLREADA